METANFNHLICFALACFPPKERAKFLARAINALDTISLPIANPITTDRVSAVFGYDAGLQGQFQLWMSNPENEQSVELARGPVKIWIMLQVLLGDGDDTHAERQELERLANQMTVSQTNSPAFSKALQRSLMARYIIIAERVRFVVV